MSKQIITDPSSDYLQTGKNPLDYIFKPRSVAVVGATEKQGSVGRTILWNLITSTFGGTVFPINPKRSNVLGIKAYPNVAAVPDAIDLAVIVTPASTVPGVIDECVAVGVKSAIVISAGFKEAGPQGLEYERQVVEKARKGNMRIIGPNCLGVMSPITGLNATFANSIARPGNVGFISQSGALCTGVLDWSFREDVGFSSFISIGSMADVDWGDLIYYLGDDPNTRSIVIYMESIGNARSFLSAAREVALTKPIIVIKAGRSAAAAKAAASHTGSLTGSDEVLDAAFERSGVLRVDAISELFYMAEVLSKQPRPKGPRLTIVTNAGGPGVLATDALINNGGELSTPSSETISELNKFLPGAWSHNNPLDILGDADPIRYAKSLEIAAKDEHSDGMLVILTPQAMTDPTQTAEHLKPYAKFAGKPVLASWMGGVNVATGEEILNRAGIPTFPYPDEAAKVFSYMWKHSESIQSLYEIPSLPVEVQDSRKTKTQAEQLIERVRSSGRTILTEYESKQLLSLYGIPTVETRIALNQTEAVKIAEQIGFPVVLKLHSETITHKTDVGGVQLNLRNSDSVVKAYQEIESAVREKASSKDFLGVTVQPMAKMDGYELILGSSVDPQFGPVLLFGTGGQLVEVFKDSSLGLPPLNSTLARRMMEKTRIYKALKGVRGRKPVELEKLEHLLVQFSRLVTEQPWIKEIDINPLLASSERLLALDARVVIYSKDVTVSSLPKPAIHPYPLQYTFSTQLKSGQQVTLRPIRPEDEPLMVGFHHLLSEESVYSHYAARLQLNERIAHERLAKVCMVDYDRDMALVAVAKDPKTSAESIVGIGRLNRIHGINDARYALIVADPYQKQGLGAEILRKLISFARDKQLSRLVADISVENKAIKQLCENEGFKLTLDQAAGVYHSELRL